MPATRARGCYPERPRRSVRPRRHALEREIAMEARPVLRSRFVVPLLLVIVAAAGTRIARGADPHPAAATRAPADPALTPAQALQRLEAGNERYAAGTATHPNQTAARRTEEAKGQHPYAVVVSCSDSRVPPELVFDEGLGDLFVIRTAGHRLDDLVLASVEYAVEHLGCRLVVVLGHERCGAVTAAVEAAGHTAAAPAAGSEETGGHVPILVRTINDAVAASANVPGDKVENAMLENVRIVVRGISAESPYLAARIRAGALQVVGARYDLDTGRVTIVDGGGTAHASK